MIRQPSENNDIVPQDIRGTSNSNALSAEPYLSRFAHDYAEEIQAELLTLMQEHESLRRSEELFRDFFENSKEAIYSHDLSGRYLMVNRAGEDLLGYSREELLQKTVFDLTPACYFAQVGQNLKQKLADHAPTIYQIEATRKDRTRIPIEVSSRLIYENGVPVGVQGTVRDISVRRQAEQALRESEERFRTLFENARDTVFTCDLQGNFTSLNRAGELLTGYTREEALKSNFSQVVAPEYLAIAMEMLIKKAAGDVETTYELELITKQGVTIMVELSSRTINENGNPVGVQGSVRDITARKRDEEALRKSEEQYRVLFDRNPQPMWVYDLKTLAFLAVNDAAVRHYGYSRERFLTMTVDEIHPPEDVPALIAEVRSINAHCHLGEWRHCDSRSNTINVEITANVIDFANRKAGLVLVNDITAHKIAEQALQNSQAQLQQSQKLEAIGQLAGGIAHDFNNLLTAIGGYSDLTLRRLSEDDPLRGNLVEIKKATDRAASLTRQLLAFSRKQILEPKVLDLNSVVNDMSKMLRRLIGEDVELVADLSADLGKVKADPGQVEQILMNLVVNARDAMPNGGKVTVETKNIVLDEEYAFHHVPVPGGEYAMIAISDTGTGMDKEIQSRVFEPFYTTKPAGKGTGLGLSTVYGIVKQSGGYVWVNSEVGCGTVFKIYLPRVDGTRDNDRQKGTSANTLHGKETILLVEDEEIVRRMARLILETHGYSVLEAGDAKEALQICFENSTKIDLLLTDVIMPGMSGRVLAERVTRLYSGLPVLYMSGYTDDAIVRHGILEDDIFFLQKPFTGELLLSKVREALTVVPAFS